MKYFRMVRNYLYKKYNFTPTQYNKLQITNLMRNSNTHLVSLFKEHLFLNDFSEFITFYFTLYESKKILKIILSIYQKTTYIFPNYTQLYECKYIYNKIYLKQKLIDYLENMDKYEKMNKKNPPKNNHNLFDSEIYNNMCLESSNRSNLKNLFGINYDPKRNDSINSLINLTKKIEEANKTKKAVKYNFSDKRLREKEKDKKDNKKNVVYNKIGKIGRRIIQRNTIKNDRWKSINFHSFIMANTSMKSNTSKLKTKPINTSKIKTIKYSIKHNTTKNLKLISLHSKDHDLSFFKSQFRKSNNNSIISNFAIKNPKLNITTTKLKPLKNLSLNTDKSFKYKLKFKNLLQTNKTTKYKKINFQKSTVPQSQSGEHQRLFLDRLSLETSKFKFNFPNIFMKRKSRNSREIFNSKYNFFTSSSVMRTNSSKDKINDIIKNKSRKKKLKRDNQIYSTVNEKNNRQSYILDSSKLIATRFKAKKSINDSLNLNSFNKKRKNLGKYLMMSTGSFHQHLKEKYHFVPINIKI